MYEFPLLCNVACHKKKKTQVCDSKTALCSEKPILGSEENKPGIIL